MAVTLPGVVRVTFTFDRAADDQVVQTYHCARLTSETPESLTALAEFLRSRWQAAGNVMQSRLPSALTLSRITAYDLNPGSAIAGEASVSGWSGTGGNPTVHQVAAVITWLTAFRGPRYRGRTYWGPLHTGMVSTAGLLEATHVANLGITANAIWLAFFDSGRPMVVPSFTGQHATDITGCRIDNSPDVQRRRQRRATAFELTTFSAP